MRLSVLVLVLAACGASDDLGNPWDQPLYEQDSDADGLTDAVELELGSDPHAVDTDGDGLADFDEIENHCDPTVVDTDGDGYSDLEEVQAGTNPAFEPSHIYPQGDYAIGTCPNPPTDVGPSGPASWGKRMFQAGDYVGNLRMEDSYGQEVTLHSFCGRKIMLSIGQGWCGPCHDKADHFAAYQRAFPDMTIIEVLTGNYDYPGTAWPTVDDLAWFLDYHDLKGIPVVRPFDQANDWSNQFEKDNYIPTVVFIDENLQVLAVDPAYNDQPSDFF